MGLGELFPLGQSGAGEDSDVPRNGLRARGGEGRLGAAVSEEGPGNSEETVTPRNSWRHL